MLIFIDTALKLNVHSLTAVIYTALPFFPTGWKPYKSVTMDSIFSSEFAPSSCLLDLSYVYSDSCHIGNSGALAEF